MLLNNSIETCIVIPCYNEAKAFPLKQYYTFLDNDQDVLLVFVNDGSTDNTIQVLEDLKLKYPNKVNIKSLDKNVGKAEAVRQGFQFCNTNYNHKYIGYLDADLSTSIEECVHLKSYMNKQILFSFGSRILIIGSVIKRSNFRHYTGRTIATIISNMLKLKVYDTQCGCKLFEAELSKKLFEKPFISRWLFDVEIFYRMIAIYGREEVIFKMLEVPLKQWVDEGDSKVKMTYFFKIWLDLFNINRAYKS